MAQALPYEPMPNYRREPTPTGGTVRSILKAFVLAPALALAAACNNDKPADPALNNDLSLAAQANPNARLDSISAAERMNGTAVTPASNLRSSAAPAAPAPARRTSTSSSTRRSSASSGGSSAGSSSGSTVASEPRVVTKKNTKRDAAIGAAAGAIVGAAASKDKVKGGIIGAAAGGILGGVIGNNVDIQKKRVP
jgi:cobalamin biosynthesis Mg chelatase CobN